VVLAKLVGVEERGRLDTLTMRPASGRRQLEPERFGGLAAYGKTRAVRRPVRWKQVRCTCTGPEGMWQGFVVGGQRHRNTA